VAFQNGTRMKLVCLLPCTGACAKYNLHKWNYFAIDQHNCLHLLILITKCKLLITKYVYLLYSLKTRAKAKAELMKGRSREYHLNIGIHSNNVARLLTRTVKTNSMLVPSDIIVYLVSQDIICYATNQSHFD